MKDLTPEEQSSLLLQLPPYKEPTKLSEADKSNTVDDGVHIIEANFNNIKTPLNLMLFLLLLFFVFVLLKIVLWRCY